MPPAELKGQVALVTGGGRGIGAGIARELASAGMRVAVSARTPEQVESVASEVNGLAVVADVSREADVDRMVSQVEEKLGPIDLLVANAGIDAFDQASWELPAGEWWHVHEVNVLGVCLPAECRCSRSVPASSGPR